MFKNLKNLTDEALEDIYKELKFEKEFGELPNGMVWSMYQDFNGENRSITLSDVKEELFFEISRRKYEENVYIIVYYNRFVNETMHTEIKAKTAFRAGREFYKKHNRKAYHNCIEKILRK